jgi:hypothetical protein
VISVSVTAGDIKMFHARVNERKLIFRNIKNAPPSVNSFLFYQLFTLRGAYQILIEKAILISARIELVVLVRIFHLPILYTKNKFVLLIFRNRFKRFNYSYDLMTADQRGRHSQLGATDKMT